MILASLAAGGPDGTLVVVSRDRQRMALPEPGPRTPQEALDDWAAHSEGLRRTFQTLEDSSVGSPIAGATFAAPLPRAFHWAEGSCYLPHMERIRGGRGEALPRRHQELPITYQSGSAPNWPPVSAVELPDVSWELDFEATVFVMTDAVEIGAGADASDRIRLVGITNDTAHA
ncbi:hypothetical protein [Dactylosporangium sp. CA-233914]|uniref:hypothetical protein n=1 Tax=Dactylosporangium sp. CA-233914 TaxID=3239934 RepID=UPI003D948B9D